MSAVAKIVVGLILVVIGLAVPGTAGLVLVIIGGIVAGVGVAQAL